MYLMRLIYILLLYTIYIFFVWTRLSVLAMWKVRKHYLWQKMSIYSRARIILCLVTLELWLPDMYSFVVFLLWQKTNLTIFKRNCFTLVLRILITIIPAGFQAGTKIPMLSGPQDRGQLISKGLFGILKFPKI